MRSKKKILFDISSVVPFYITGHLQGVGRSTMELIKALDGIGELPFDFILFSQNLKGIGVSNLPTHFMKHHLYLPKRHPFIEISDFFKLKKILSGYDLMHIPHNTDSWENLPKTLYTIHDLIVYRYPEMWGLKEAEREVHKKIASQCKAIVTCSHSSKRDIIKFWGCGEDKVMVIPWGVNREIFSPDHRIISEIPNLKRDFFFCSACNHPRKQPDLILDSYECYLKQGGTAQLVMLSPKVKNIEKLNILQESGKVIALNGISDQLLVKLYSQAKATIVVSLYEGFGLPVLESLACGTQVICAYNSSLIEAGGNIVDYLLDLSPEALCSKMQTYDNNINRPEKRECESHLNNFTWAACAKKYVDFWCRQLNV